MPTPRQVTSFAKPTRPEIDFSPELLEHARSRVERVVQAARTSSPDTVLFLTMTELQQLFPDLSDIELSGLYRAIMPHPAPGKDRGLA